MSGVSNRPSSTSDSATRFTVWPSSSAMSCAVSASITSVILCIAPWRISILITSTARSDMRLASSWMVIVSGSTTSRESFSFSGPANALQALDAAPEGGDRARALFLAAGGGGDGQAAAALFLAGRGAGRARRHDHLGRHAGTANDALGLFLLRRAGGTGDRRHGDRARGSARSADRRAGSRSRGRRGRAAFAQAALGLFLGAALGFCVVLAAGLFLALARFGGLALGALLRLALGAGARLDLGDAAFFLLAPLGVEQGAGAGLALLFRQGAQDDAGRARAGRLGGWRGAGTGAAGRGLGGSGSSLYRGGRRSGRRRLRLGRGGLGSAEDAPLHLLDHDLLRAAVGEALPHDA